MSRTEERESNDWSRSPVLNLYEAARLQSVNPAHPPQYTNSEHGTPFATACEPVDSINIIHGAAGPMNRFSRTGQVLDPRLQMLEAVDFCINSRNLRPTALIHEHQPSFESWNRDLGAQDIDVGFGAFEIGNYEEAALHAFPNATPEYEQLAANLPLQRANQRAEYWSENQVGISAPRGQGNMQQRQPASQQLHQEPYQELVDFNTAFRSLEQHEPYAQGSTYLAEGFGEPNAPPSLYYSQNIDGPGQASSIGVTGIETQSSQSYSQLDSNGNLLDFARGPIRSSQSANTIITPFLQAPRSETYQDSPQPRTSSGKNSCAEENCQRGVKIPGTYCKRHQQKYDRNHALPPDIPFLRTLSSESAMEMVYPRCPGFSQTTPDDSLPKSEDHAKALEEHWTEAFLRAAMDPVDSRSPNTSDFQRDQQEKFNGKALMEKKGEDRYSNAWINARMRLLFQTALRFHTGGPSIYPVGGDNAGYGKPDLDLSFNDRLEALCNLMREDKLIVMNVIEARGVIPLVQNPTKFRKRKTQNKQSNKKKDEVLEAERKRQRDATVEAKDESSGDDNDDGDDDEIVGPPEPMRGPRKAAGTKEKRQATAKSPKAPQPRRSKRVKSEPDAPVSGLPRPGDVLSATSPTIFSPQDEMDEQDALVARLPRADRDGGAFEDSTHYWDHINYPAEPFGGQHGIHWQRLENPNIDPKVFGVGKQSEGWL